tara:strand:+ start:221 stop:391 length:171 start_codon:yes stop_codon:yes gene_type:complete
MPRIRPSSDDRDYPHDGGYLEEDYRLDQLRFAEAPAEKVTPKRSKPFIEDSEGGQS